MTKAIEEELTYRYKNFGDTPWEQLPQEEQARREAIDYSSWSVDEFKSIDRNLKEELLLCGS